MTPSMIARSSGVRCERSGMSSMAGAASRERARARRVLRCCARGATLGAPLAPEVYLIMPGEPIARDTTLTSARLLIAGSSPTLKRRRQLTPFLTVMRAHFFLVIHLSVSIYNFLLYQLQIIRNIIINCYRLRLIFFYFIHVFLSIQRYITEVQSQSRGGGTHSPGKWFTRSLWNRLLTPSLQGNFFERMRIYS